MAMMPIMRIRNAITATEYGLLKANLTIHMIIKLFEQPKTIQRYVPEKGTGKNG